MQNTQVALEILKKQLDPRLIAALEVCVRCGICADACHYYAGNGHEVRHVPAARAEGLRKIYRRLFDPLGQIAPKWIGAADLDEQALDELTEIAYASCTLCRRCTINCPMGVDTALIMRTARAMLTAAGKAPEMLVQLADAAIARGENLEFFKDLFLEQTRDLEKELQEKTGDPTARIPIEKEGAEMLYVALSGAHTILPAATIFHKAGASWTLSLFEAANYGVFIADTARSKQIAQRIVEEAERLKVKEVVITECGHACAALRWEAPNWFDAPLPFHVRSLVEVLAEYVREGRIRVNPTANTEPITYHDSCNLARSGGIIEEPRIVLRAVASDFREMTPNGYENYCCGGGGGLVAIPEWNEIRLKAGKPKAGQIKATGARVVVASCDNCRLQLSDLNEHYDLGVQVTGLAALVANALKN